MLNNYFAFYSQISRSNLWIWSCIAKGGILLKFFLLELKRFWHFISLFYRCLVCQPDSTFGANKFKKSSRRVFFVPHLNNTKSSTSIFYQCHMYLHGNFVRGWLGAILNQNLYIKIFKSIFWFTKLYGSKYFAS